jgi:hypothetical protein
MFVDFFIRRPIFATVCALMIILAGAVSIPTLPVAELPNLALPQDANYLSVLQFAVDILRARRRSAAR